jgi:fructose-specific component phosphotransferase system IIB-like protein
MERNVPLIRPWLAVAALAAAALATALSWAAPADDSRLVLVAGSSSPLATLTTSDVRRLYLGVPLTHAGREITALRNA